jgi:flagellar biosynthetic protein FliR
VEPSFLGVVVDELSTGGVDIVALGLAWARATPTVVLVPAFGLKAVPAPARTVFALALAASIFPSVTPIVAVGRTSWGLLALAEVVRGVPIALAAAIPLWAATMAGGVVDALRGANDPVSAPTVEGRATPLGVPLSILACTLFLSTGGPARVATALATRPLDDHPLLSAAHDVTGGIELAVAIAAPLLAAAVVIEIAAALVARASTPAQIHALLAPIRALGLLAVLAIVFERVAGALERVVAVAP